MIQKYNDTIMTTTPLSLIQSIRLDFRSEVPIYLQLVEQIRAQIEAGLLKPGQQLPTVRALAIELRINFNTVARAYRILDEAGLISTQQGRGTFVSEIPPPALSAPPTLSELARAFVRQARHLNVADEEIRRAFEEALNSPS